MRKKSIDNGGIKNEKISKRQENSYKTVKEEERAAGGGKKIRGIKCIKGFFHGKKKVKN